MAPWGGGDGLSVCNSQLHGLRCPQSRVCRVSTVRGAVWRVAVGGRTEK